MTPWWNQVITAVPEHARAALAQPGLADRLVGELEAAHARWPDAALADDTFAATLAARIGAQQDLEPPVTSDELLQTLRSKLCVASGGRAPRTAGSTSACRVCSRPPRSPMAPRRPARDRLSE